MIIFQYSQGNFKSGNFYFVKLGHFLNEFLILYCIVDTHSFNNSGATDWTKETRTRAAEKQEIADDEKEEFAKEKLNLVTCDIRIFFIILLFHIKFCNILLLFIFYIVIIFNSCDILTVLFNSLSDKSKYKSWKKEGYCCRICIWRQQRRKRKDSEEKLKEKLKEK